MVVDCHAHVPSLRNTWGLPYFSPEGYLAKMDALGIGRTVMLPFDGLYHPAGPCNDEVREFCDTDPHRLIAFGTVNPRDPGAADEVTRCVTELGMRGLKLHPWMQAFAPMEPVMFPIYERAREHGIPLLFHDGTPPLSTPLQIAQVAREFPELTVVLGHGGLNDYYDEAVTAAVETPGVWICMSSLHAHAIREIIAEGPRDRIIFGSDGGLAPLEDQSYVDHRWELLRDLGLSDATLEDIVGANPARLLDGD